MVNFWRVVNEVIRKADVILEVIDARFPELSRNPELEEKIRKSGKKIIIVLNKSDLAKSLKMPENSVLVSARNKLGTSLLKRKILSVARQDKITVGVVGYPNTGKSSVINALSGKAKTSTSSQSGYTRGLQFVNAGSRISLIDTPGVIPFGNKDEVLQAIIGAKDPSNIKDPDLIAAKLIEALDGKAERFYGVDMALDSYEKIEKIAEKKNILVKGGTPNIDAMSRRIIMDWQRGVIK